MCGIVGYVGSQVASDRPLDVVLEGLRRLEYRGYDSAGVALVSPTGTLATAKKAGKLANLVEELDLHPLPESTAAIGHTRWATHGGPTDVNAHPHVAGKLAVIHNGIVENFATLKAELVADGVEFTSETDTEVAAQLIARAYDEPRATSPRRCRRSRGRCTARSRCWPSTRTPPTSWSAPGTTPRWSSASATARTSSGPTSRRSSRTPARRSSSARTRWSPSPPTPSPSRTSTAARRRRVATRSTGTPRPPRRAASRTFMDKEIHDQPHAVADTLLGRTDAHGRLVLDELRIDESVLRVGRQDRRRRLRHRRLRRARRQVRDRALVPDPGRGRAGPRVPLPRPGGQRAHAGRRDLAVGRDDGHAHGRPARPRAGRQGARARATPTARPSRASPTRCSTRTPAPRSRSPPPRRSSPRSPPPTCSASTSPSCAATSSPTRSAAILAELRAMPDKIQQVLDRADRVREIARSMVDTRVGAVPRPARRLPRGDGGRAQAQGARLHPRRGVRGGRAQARSDRAHRAGAAGVRHRARRRADATRCTRRSSPTSRRSAPAAPAPS